MKYGKIQITGKSKGANKIKTLQQKNRKNLSDMDKKYIYYHQKRHPVTMGGDEINRFLSFLACEKKVAASTQNQALNAILFLYRYVLDMELEISQAVVPHFMRPYNRVVEESIHLKSEIMFTGIKKTTFVLI